MKGSIVLPHLPQDFSRGRALDMLLFVIASSAGGCLPVSGTRPDSSLHQILCRGMVSRGWPDGIERVDLMTFGEREHPRTDVGGLEAWQLRRMATEVWLQV